MKFTPKQVVPSNGKYFVEVLPLEEKTAGGVLLPQVTDASGRPLTSIPQTPIGRIVAVGGPSSKGTPNQQMPEYEAGDLVLLSVVPAGVPLANDRGVLTLHVFVDFYQVLAKLKR